MSRPGAAPLVLTGATGFIGRELVRQLAAMNGGSARSVSLLLRHPGSLPPDLVVPPHWQIIQCDLSDPGVELPPGALPPGCVVLHLGAATGRAPASLLHEVNAGGTRRLAAAARAAGASHFILVSSIAAGYPNRRWYPYAASKLAAEAATSASGVPATVVRPTVVFGPGSRVQAGLEQLALGRLPIVLGQGDVLVQPVDVRDLAALLLGLVDSPPAGPVPVEVGGRERHSMHTLLARIRSAHGLPARSPWPVPLGMPRLALALAESVLGSRLPVTAGQLSAFLNDSVATPHPLVDALLPAGDSLRAVGPGPAATSVAVDSAAGAPATIVEQEFRVFAAHLGTTEPPPDSVAAYRRGYARTEAIPTDGVDRWLARIASRSPGWCALADCYARLVRPHGLLRRKLVLALAVLEAGPVTHADYDEARPAPMPTAWATVVLHGLRWLATLTAAILVLGPRHLFEPRYGPPGVARDG